MKAWGTRTCYFSLALVLAAGCTEREVGPVHLRPLAGEAVVAFKGSSARSEGSENFRSIDLREGISVRQDGDILDPRIATFSLEVQPQFSQEFRKRGDQERGTNGLILDYRGALSALHGTPSPVSFNAQASRTSSDREGDLGSRSESDVTGWDAALKWKLRYFPTSLRYQERHTERSFRSGLGDTTTDRDTVQRRLGLRGASSKMSASLEREWFDYRDAQQNNDRTTDRAHLAHRFPWGKGSMLRSSLRYFNRKGRAANEQISIGESARIQHSENLSSDTRYRFLTRLNGGELTSHSGNFSLRHRLYRSLNTSLGLSAARSKSGVSEEDKYNGGLGLGYSKGISWGGRFSASAGGSYGLTDRKSDGGRSSVFDEPHDVDTTTISFQLNQRRVVESTIVVTDDSGITTFIVGIDYQVVALASDLTEIRPIPGGAISAAAPITVLVSYEFEVRPTSKFATTSVSSGARLDFGWISLSHNEFWSNDKLLSGTEVASLRDSRRSRTGLTLRWTGGKTRGTLSATRNFSRSDSSEIETFSVRQSLFHSLSSRASLNLGASEVFSESNGRDTDQYNVNLALNWRPLARLSLRPHGEAWLRRERATSGGDRIETHFLSAGLDLNWAWRKVQFQLRYNHNERGGDISDRSEDRVTTTLTRIF